MFCPACGKQVDESDAFCRACGKSTGPAPPVASVQSASPTQVQVKNVYAGKKQQLVGGIIFVIGLFVMIGSCAEASPDNAGTGWAWTWLVPLFGLLRWLSGGIKHWWHN